MAHPNFVEKTFAGDSKTANVSPSKVFRYMVAALRVAHKFLMVCTCRCIYQLTCWNEIGIVHVIVVLADKLILHYTGYCFIL